MGLVVTELMINALKYAFPDHDREGRVIVRCEAHGDHRKLSVSDDGVAKQPAAPQPKGERRRSARHLQSDYEV